MESMSLDQASDYLSALLDTNLRIHTDDERMFVGMFKCTDNVKQMTQY